MALSIVPCSIKDANAFVAQWHRHHRPTNGGLFAVACADGDRVCGVALVARPVTYRLDDGWTAEVTRLATDGTRNACSMLYAACWRRWEQGEKSDATNPARIRPALPDDQISFLSDEVAS